jgi:hypothetical protein
MTQAQIIKRLKAGETLIVRAKNGHCFPMFTWQPSAYRCRLGKTPIPSATSYRLMKSRVIQCVNEGWYSEGHFGFNRNLRDPRGRFLPRIANRH